MVDTVLLVSVSVIFHYADRVQKLDVTTDFFKAFSDNAVFNRFIFLNSTSGKQIKRMYFIADQGHVIFMIKNNRLPGETVFKNDIL